MAMIFVNRDRQSLGQFTEQDISNGLADGRFLPEDLAWKEGMEAWQPLSAFTDLPPAGATPAAVPPLVRTFDYAAANVLQPGRIRFDECLSKAWECFLQNWGICVLTTLAFFAITIVVQIPMQFAQTMLERFSGAGSSGQVWIMVGMGVVFLFFYLLATGISSILSAGFMYFFIQALRTNKANIDHLFAGFTKSNWIQILLAVLVWVLAVILMVVVFLTPAVILTAMMKSEMPVIVAVVLVCIPVIYFSVGIGFVFPLIVDRQIGFWEAIRTSLKTVHRQWFQAFGLMILVGLVAMVGLLACCVGMLATIPLAYLIWCQGYRQLFGDGESPGR